MEPEFRELTESHGMRSVSCVNLGGGVSGTTGASLQGTSWGWVP